MRFRLVHLLGFMAFAGIVMQFHRVSDKASRTGNVTVEISGVDPSGSIVYEFDYRNGFGVGRAFLPTDSLPDDLDSILGERYCARYRPGRYLWLGEEDPSKIARRIVADKLAHLAHNEIHGGN